LDEFDSRERDQRKNETTGYEAAFNRATLERYGRTPALASAKAGKVESRTPREGSLRQSAVIAAREKSVMTTASAW
jgi:hypothetical protein